MIDVGQLDVLPGRLLDRCGQHTHLGPILLVGGGDVQGQEVVEGWATRPAAKRSSRRRSSMMAWKPPASSQRSARW
ncbi:MAG TPA: hypothetical protein VMU89_07525 [Thermomicrobiaceae bacterium]|nr:hypothetical protein [Thermomicrobiaceae bacterium]